MSQYFAPADLTAMTEQELRALRGRLLADLRRSGQSAFLCPGIYASLANIDAALLALQARLFAPQRPVGLKPPGL